MSGFMAFPLGEPSPEEKAAYEEKVAEMKMKIQAARDSRREFFESLNVEQLVELQKIFIEMAHQHDAHDAQQLASRWFGTTTTLLEYVHKVCAGCGKDHVADDIAEICTENT